MKQFLKLPAVNAVCISLFTGFYAWIFLIGNFFTDGYQTKLAWFIIAITIFVVILLIRRQHPYDEYHTTILTHCLITAMVLTLIAIAIFYLVILTDPSGIVEKFTFFIILHWITVVLCDLVYVLLCNRR